MKKRTFKKLAQEAWDRAADADALSDDSAKRLAQKAWNMTAAADALSDQCSCEDCQAQDSIVDSVIPKPTFQAMTTEVMNTYNSLRSLGTQAAPLDPITTLQIAWDIVRNARHDW